MLLRCPIFSKGYKIARKRKDIAREDGCFVVLVRDILMFRKLLVHEGPFTLHSGRKEQQSYVNIFIVYNSLKKYLMNHIQYLVR